MNKLHRLHTPPRVNVLDLTITAATGREYAAYVRRNLRKAYRVLNPPLRELSIAFVGDRRMAELHMQFMNIPGPTDVLTFPLDEDPHGEVTTGEVVICVPEARRQSKAHHVPVQQELLLYAVHGMLHLAGFDDRTPLAYKKMHATEDELLSRIGVGVTFAVTSVSAPVTAPVTAAAGKPSARTARAPSRALP